MIPLLYQITGVQIVGNGLEGMGLPATPDRKTNMNQNLFGLGGTQSLLLCQISANQSLLQRERMRHRKCHTHDLPGILRDVTEPSQALLKLFI